MTEVKAIDNRVKKPFIKAIAITLSIFLMAISVIIGAICGAIMGLIIIWALLLKKCTVINSEGIIVNYDARVFKYSEKWAFYEVTNIHRECVKDSNFSILHFTKGCMSKRLIFTSEDACKVIEFARAKNSKIYFNDVG